MKNTNYLLDNTQDDLSNEQNWHAQFEALLRHRLVLGTIIAFLSLALIYSDVHFGKIIQRIAPSFGWVDMYARQEHPTHERLGISINRLPTIAGTL